jgi:hypothetical protein
MTECEELIGLLRLRARDQVNLALLASSDAVVGMHLDLAEFREQQARVAEELCEEQ